MNGGGAPEHPAPVPDQPASATLPAVCVVGLARGSVSWADCGDAQVRGGSPTAVVGVPAVGPCRPALELGRQPAEPSSPTTEPNNATTEPSGPTAEPGHSALEPGHSGGDIGHAALECGSPARFDYTWFGLTAADAARLAAWQLAGLELAVAALDDSGLGYAARGSNAAVVFGAAECGPRGTDNLANRLSRALGLRGPSLILDSEPSSAAAAVDTAARLLADPSVPFVIAGGMDLPLTLDISSAHQETHRNGGEFTVVVVQRVADATLGGIRMHAEITGITGFSGGVGETHIPLDPNSAHAHNDRLARSDRGDEPPVLIALSGRDALEVHETALRWAQQLDTHRSLREFAAATGRLLPGPVRAAVLGRDTDDAAAQLRSLADRIAATRRPVSAAERARQAERIAQAEQLRPTVRTARAARARQERDGQVGYPLRAGQPGRGERNGHAASAGETGQSALARPVEPHQHTQQPAHVPRPHPDECIRTFGHAPQGEWRTEPGCRTEAAPAAAIEVFGPSTVGAGGGLLLLCSGAREPYPGMGRGMAARYPVFARALMTATDAVVAAGGPRVWTPRFGFGNGTGGGEFAQAATFVYQVAMAELLARWGVRPDAVVGYGTGEMAAAAVGGALSLADAARVVVAHSRMAARAESAATAVLEATAVEAMRLVEPMRAAVTVAAIDSPRSVTVSGEARYIDALVRRAHRRTISAQRLTDHNGGWHPAVPSPRSRELAPLLVDELAGITPRVPTVALYSTTRAGAALSAEMDAAYWGEHARGPVNLTAALEHAAAAGMSTILEIAPHPTLTPTVREHATFRDSTHPVAARADEPATFLRALAHLHLEGRPLDWTALGPCTAPPPPRHWRHPHPAPHPPTAHDTGPHAVSTTSDDRRGSCTAAPRTPATAPGDEPFADTRTQPTTTPDNRPRPNPTAPDESHTAPGEEPYLTTAQRQPAAEDRERRHPGASVPQRSATAPGDRSYPGTAGAPRTVDVSDEERRPDGVRSARPDITAGDRVASRAASGSRDNRTPTGRSDTPTCDDAASPPSAPRHASRAVGAAGEDSAYHPVRWGYCDSPGVVDGPVWDAEVRSESTYVVTGRLGPAGVRAVCWLLAAGASDVVLLTREPRALPPPLDGWEDRIVLVRCDIADRDDLAQVLHDLRECGPPIRGVVHTGAGRTGAAANVLELTAADAPDFTVLVAVADGARAELDRLAAAHGYRRVVRVDWDDAAHRVSEDETGWPRG
ncbi:acyltransferase domain-containing protein [Nocardia otitidiscaviarum]|uniref:acyltransferase domain-containing protein n=1 Tax=Nocardia otitidiscaviarum TaxID=1823 RepID=UPI00226BBEEB|nr:acyltransferase domain-containing protein [Nocardia otitidiscaviarum]